MNDSAKVLGFAPTVGVVSMDRGVSPVKEPQK